MEGEGEAAVGVDGGALPVAAGEPLPATTEVEGRALEFGLVQLRGASTTAAVGSVIRVRVRCRVEATPDLGFDSVAAHTASVVDAFASPPLIAAPTRWAAARLRWKVLPPAAEGGVSVAPGRALNVTLCAGSTDAPAASSRMLLQVMPDAEDPLRLELGLEVNGPGPTGEQIHEFVHLSPGPRGASCSLWLPDLLAAGRRDLGGFRVEVELLGWGTPESVPSAEVEAQPETPAPVGAGDVPLDLREPRLALREAGRAHPVLLDLALTAPISWVEDLLARAAQPTTADALARAAWELLSDPEKPEWATSICDRYAGALALRPSRLSAILRDTPEPSAWHAAFLRANDALLTDPQPEVRVRATRFLRDALPAGYDPLRRDDR